MTTAPVADSPADRATYPNTTPSTPIASASGATARSPSRYAEPVLDVLLTMGPALAGILASTIVALRSIYPGQCSRKPVADAQLLRCRSRLTVCTCKHLELDPSA